MKDGPGRMAGISEAYGVVRRCRAAMEAAKGVRRIHAIGAVRRMERAGRADSSVLIRVRHLMRTAALGPVPLCRMNRMEWAALAKDLEAGSVMVALMAMVGDKADLADQGGQRAAPAECREEYLEECQGE